MKVSLSHVLTLSNPGLYGLWNSPGQNIAKKKKKKKTGQFRANVIGNMSYSLLLKHLFIVVLFNLFYPPHKNVENPMGTHKIPKITNWKCFKTNKGMGIKWVGL